MPPPEFTPETDKLLLEAIVATVLRDRGRICGTRGLEELKRSDTPALHARLGEMLQSMCEAYGAPGVVAEKEVQFTDENRRKKRWSGDKRRWMQAAKRRKLEEQEAEALHVGNGVKKEEGEAGPSTGPSLKTTPMTGTRSQTATTMGGEPQAHARSESVFQVKVEPE